MKSLGISLIVLLGVVGCADSTSQNSKTDRTPEKGVAVSSSTTVKHKDNTAEQKDNTAINERDRSTTAKTPIDQNENQKDIDITASIRKRVIGTKLSTNAHNSKIITQEGRVTLRGPVATEDEKKTIELIAIDVAGEGNVESQLEVQP